MGHCDELEGHGTEWNIIYALQAELCNLKCKSFLSIHPSQIIRNVKKSPRLPNFLVFWAQSRLCQFLNGFPIAYWAFPIAYWAFSAMDWAFPFTHWCLMLDACLMVHGSRLMAHGQGGPVRPWCPRERRGLTQRSLGPQGRTGPPWPWAMNHEPSSIKH